MNQVVIGAGLIRGRIVCGGTTQPISRAGGPGIEPRWTRANKTGIGTAYSDLSRVWFTLSRGAVNEVSFPTIDRPQIRDFQYLVTDGETFFHDGRRHARHQVDYLARHTLGYRVTTHCPEGRYMLVRDIITDPHRPCCSSGPVWT